MSQIKSTPCCIIALMENTVSDFTEGRITGKLIKFMIPILGSLVLQAAYGAADVLMVGWFGTTEGLSGVSTGSSIINLVQMGCQFAIKQQRGVICFLVLPEVSMAHSAVLAIPGRFFFWEFQVGVVHSVCTKGVGAAHFWG